MAVYFLDSSALVKRYITETGTLWVRRLCEPAAGHELQAEVVAYLSGQQEVRKTHPTP